MSFVMGIDVGTSGVKCIIINEKGEVLASDTQSYPLSTPQNGWSEQDPADWWEGTKKAIKNVIKKSAIDNSEITALGFSGQMHGLVALDENDEVIRPAILWNDQRTSRECDEIIEMAGGLEGLLSYTNNTMLTGFTGGKILWLKKNEPENYKRMKSFFMPKDYIRFMLTGKKFTDVSDASGTGFFDVEKREWSRELIDLVGLDFSAFPQSLESDKPAGSITKEAAEQTGLKEGMTAYAGGGDAVIQTTGMGIVQEGTIGLIIGTSGVVSMALDGFGKNEGGKLQFFCNNDKDKWQAFGCQLSSGGSLEWLKDTLYEGDDPFREINEGAEKSGVGAKKLLFLPYLTGERSPHPDPDARGVFFGLSLMHSKGDMARAVMEGVTFGMREIFELIVASKPDLTPTQVFTSGGASKSPLWRQIQADIFGLPVKTLTGAAEGGAYGAAVVAGVGAGIWSDIVDAAGNLAQESVTLPIKENKEKYDAIFPVYKGLYEDLKDRFKQL